MIPKKALFENRHTLLTTVSPKAMKKYWTLTISVPVIKNIFRCEKAQSLVEG